MTNIDPSLPTDDDQQPRKRSRHPSPGSVSPPPPPPPADHHHQHALSSLDPTLSAINDRMAEHTPKRKRPSDRDFDHQDHPSRPSLDTLQLAHLITSIQAHPEHSASAAPLETGANSHLANYNALPNYLLQSGSTGEPEWQEKWEALLKPLKHEISRLRSRLEFLEDNQMEMAREITSLKGSLKIPPPPQQRPFPGSSAGTHATPLSSARDQHSRSNMATILAHPTTPNCRALDIPVGPLPEMGGPGGSSQATSTSTSNPHHHHHHHHPVAVAALTPTASSEGKAGIPQAIITSSSKFETGASFRRSSTRKKSEASLNGLPSSSSTPTQASSSNNNNSNNRAKHRKPELSRTVRATVFRLMGVSSSHSPMSSETGLSNNNNNNANANDTTCKFGNEKSRAYHGYTTSPCFPEYTAEELYDPVTKARIWRWDWAKTIRQSQNNTNFAKEIRNVIAREAADPTRPMHTEVPASDWLYLDDAIDSAYTNMRRERDNLLDPNKMVKKEVHRARNKKRGLKEDKFKRRRKALDDYRADPHSFAQRLRDADLRLADKPVSMMARDGAPPVGNGGSSNNNDKEHGGEDDGKAAGDESSSAAAHEARWDDALDIKYMSSEDEANVHDFSSPVPVGSDKPDNTLAASDKVFAICRPTWRSAQLHNLFAVLDTIKQPERAYRRVLGPVRITRPPIGTPSWMLNDAAESLEYAAPSHESPGLKNDGQHAPPPAPTAPF